MNKKEFEKVSAVLASSSNLIMTGKFDHPFNQISNHLGEIRNCLMFLKTKMDDLPVEDAKSKLEVKEKLKEPKTEGERSDV